MRSARCHVPNRLAVGKKMKLENCLLDASFVPNFMRGWGKFPEKKKQFRQEGFVSSSKNTFDERIKFLGQATKAGAQLLGLPPSL